MHNHLHAKDKLYGLDHLRALAILMVVLFHYRLAIFGHPEKIVPYVSFGWTGVDLFFVLSGFLISSQLFAQIREGKSISLKDFFLKRFFRIVPLYLFIVAIYFSFPYFREKEALAPIWKFLTFTQNFGLDAKVYGTFSHAWSLCVEEQFYFFFPLILMLLLAGNLFKRSYLILPFLFIAGFAIRYYMWQTAFLPNLKPESLFTVWTRYMYYPTYNRLDGLITGIAVAAVYQFLPAFWERVSRFGNMLIITALLILAAGYFVCLDFTTYNTAIYGFPLVSVGYGFLVAGAVSPGSVLYRWNSKSTTFIAMLSYGIYLSHKGVIHVVQQIFGALGVDKNSFLMLAICLIFCVLAALLLNIAIEKPFLKMRDKILKRKSAVIGELAVQSEVIPIK